MIFEFDVKYGHNIVELPNGDRVEFDVKYGLNKIRFTFEGKTVETEFRVKYGHNTVRFVVDDELIKTDWFSRKVTIYNDVPAGTLTPRMWKRHTIDKCNIQGMLTDRLNNTVVNIVNAQTIITKNIEHYKSPIEYDKLPEDVKSEYYTVRTGDFIVFDEVDDIVTNATEWSRLQQKYKDNGIRVTNVNVNIHNMALDNIQIS